MMNIPVQIWQFCSPFKANGKKSPGTESKSSQSMHSIKDRTPSSIEDSIPSQLIDRRVEQRTPTAILLMDETCVSIAPGSVVSVGRATDEFPLMTDHYTFRKANLSRLHIYIGVDGSGRIFISDHGTIGNGSISGTYVNGNRLSAGQISFVDDHDAIWLGKPNEPGSLRLEVVNLLNTKVRS